MTGHEGASVALRWVIEHKQCSGFQQCWAAAPPEVREQILTAWGEDPWPVPVVHRKPPTLPHPFEPSGVLVGRSRVEACAACGLAQRGAGTMHPDSPAATGRSAPVS